MVNGFIRRGSKSIDADQCVRDKAKAVFQLVRRTQPLTVKQVDYCDEPCILRFLKSNGSHVKKAAKQLTATLSWRANLDVDYLTADEFSAELAAGSAFVAGQDDEGRSIILVTLRPEQLTGHSHKQFLRFFVFTMEVGIACMPPTSQQCVLILDAGALKKGSLGLSMIVHLLRIVGDHYPERVARTFVVDPPFLVYYLWKGIGTFIDLGMKEKLRFVSSGSYNVTSAASHLMRAAKSYSSRNLWIEHSDNEEDDRFDFHASMRPNRSQTSSISPVPDRDSSCSFGHSVGAALVSDKTQARSFSFASPATPSGWTYEPGTLEFRSFRVDNQPLHNRREESQFALHNGNRRWVDFSTSFWSRREQSQLMYNQKERSVDLFRPFWDFFLSSYDEGAYRARMKAPLGGLISIVSPDLKREGSFEGKCVEAMLHRLDINS